MKMNEKRQIQFQIQINYVNYREKWPLFIRLESMNSKFNTYS